MRFAGRASGLYHGGAVVAASDTQVSPDVLVVGGGGAGLCAALEARAAGASVLVLEGEEEPGGASIVSGGTSCLVGTPLQRANGIEDTPDLAFADWVSFGGGAADEPWVRFYLEHSLHEVHGWLERLGVRYIGLLWGEGNTIPRCHRPQGGGRAVWTALHASCQGLGVPLRTGHLADELLVEGGRVVGVRGRRTGGYAFEQRAGAVVMASGGFMSNLDMVHEFAPHLREIRVLEGSAPSARGAGHRAIAAIGGLLTHMDHIWMYVFTIPDHRDPRGRRGLLLHGIYDYVWVNAQGRRFHNEELFAGGSGTRAVLAQRPPFCWAVVDAEIVRGLSVSDPYYRRAGQSDPERVAELLRESPHVKRADTLAGLARTMEVPEEVFVAGVERYNDAIMRGLPVEPDCARPLRGAGRMGGAGGRVVPLRGDPDYAQPLPDRRPILVPPFYAFQFFPMARKSFGGVKTDLACRVLDRHCEPIAGLLAAGELAGMAGGHINGKGGLEGTMFAPCLFSGRVAGAWAAQATGHGPGFRGRPLR
ncbi:MAG: FAD-dependent oxidoreductase [Chloroflexi bacterium]|nr:FAD-dependent oxidoreductase [Chloroflexota bacterium]